MLTPHQIASLFVAMNAPEKADVDSPDLISLVEKRLVQYAHEFDKPRVYLTPEGIDLAARLTSAPSKPAFELQPRI